MTLGHLLQAHAGDTSAMRHFLSMMLQSPQLKDRAPSLRDIQWGWKDEIIKPLLWEKIANSPNMREVCYPLWEEGRLSLNVDDKVRLGELLLRNNQWFNKPTAFSHDIAMTLWAQKSPYVSYLLLSHHNTTLVPLLSVRQLKKWIKECDYPYFNKKILFRYGMIMRNLTPYDQMCTLREDTYYDSLSEQALISQSFWGEMVLHHKEEVFKDAWASSFLARSAVMKINNLHLMQHYFFTTNVDDDTRQQWLIKCPLLSQEKEVHDWIKGLPSEKQYPLIYQMVKAGTFNDMLQWLDDLWNIQAFPFTDKDYIDLINRYDQRALLERILHWHFFGVPKTLSEWNTELQMIDPELPAMTVDSLSQGLEHDILPSEITLNF